MHSALDKIGFLDIISEEVCNERIVTMDGKSARQLAAEDAAGRWEDEGEGYGDTE